MRIYKSLICFVFMFLAGCGLNPDITGSNMETGYHKKIHSLSIIYLASKLGVDESSINREDFNKLSAPFTAAGIKTDLFFYSDLDLNADENLEKYAKKNAYILIINPTHMTTGDTVNITYNLSVYDAATQRKIWVANLWVPYGWVKSIYQRYDEMGSSIVQKLIDSGLVTQKTM